MVLYLMSTFVLVQYKRRDSNTTDKISVAPSAVLIHGIGKPEPLV